MKTPENKVIKLLTNYILHVQKRKDYYFGKSQELYNRYDCHEVLLKDLLTHIKDGKVER